MTISASLKRRIVAARSPGWRVERTRWTAPLLVFHVPERTIVEAFARSDPNVTNGLVTRWVVRSWTVVIGNEPAE